MMITGGPQHGNPMRIVAFEQVRLYHHAFVANHAPATRPTAMVTRVVTVNHALVSQYNGGQQL